MEVKLQLYSCAVVSVLVYGSEAWTLTAGLTKALNGWNLRCLHTNDTIPGKSYREEAVDPRYNLVSKIRATRLRRVRHVLREEESHPVTQCTGAEMWKSNSRVHNFKILQSPRIAFLRLKNAIQLYLKLCTRELDFHISAPVH